MTFLGMKTKCVIFIVVYIICLYIEILDDLRFILGGPCKYSYNYTGRGIKLKNFNRCVKFRVTKQLLK